MYEWTIQFIYEFIYEWIYLQLIGRIGIPLLMKVASMYNTMEIGTFPAPILFWANWNEMEPFAWLPRILSAKYMYELIYEWTYEIRSDWDKNVNQICSAPVTIQILILFESKMLTSVQSFIRQQFSQNLFDLSAEELDILVAVTF